jgi:hypothetical protein
MGKSPKSIVLRIADRPASSDVIAPRLPLTKKPIGLAPGRSHPWTYTYCVL